MNPFKMKCVLVALCLALILLGASATQNENHKQKKHPKVQLISSVQGADLFHAYCATCHGDSGKGDGSLASFLDVKVTDLTTISKRSGGVFPEKRVYNIIAGKEVLKGHGTREMPIWGPIFHQKDDDLGKLRLKNVTSYVQSIQEK